MDMLDALRLNNGGGESRLNQPNESMSAAVMKIPGVMVAKAHP
jgi:hypothetical protein